MTDEEKLIEKAARAISTARYGTASNWINCQGEAEAALEAVGYFDLRAKLDALVEAGEQVIIEWDEDNSLDIDCTGAGPTPEPQPPHIATLRALVFAAKEQSHD